MDYKSDRKKLISTLSYPGLAIKGIAAVGPTLDVYGQIRGVVQLSGTMSAGAKYTFEKSEVFWPEGDDSTDYSKIKDLVDDPEPVTSGLEPSFQANVQASADLDIMVTPEANIGIVVGGSALLGGVTLVDAQLAGFVNTTLRFHADASAGVAGDSSGVSAGYAYNYGIYLLYNLGYGGHASIPFYDWYITTRYLFSNAKTITLYSNGDVASVSTASTKRSLSMDELPIFDADDANIANPGQRQSMGRSISFDSNRDLLWGSQPQFMNGTSHILQKREDDDGDIEMMDVDDEDPNFSQSSALTCPDNDCVTSGSSNPNNLPVCSWILPELRYNCDVFSNAQATKNGASEPVTGICRNVVNFLDGRNLDVSEGVVLTWDSFQDRQDVRRSQACPKIAKKGYCSAYNAAIATKLQVPTDSKIVSCDEFPVASSEEGGSYFASLPQNPTSVEVKCVPVWQQTIQGNCNKMLSNIESNVNVSGTAIWQKWASTNNDWFKTSDWQRVVHYTDYIPQAHNIDDTQYNNGHGGWLHKRNFTLSVAQPSGPKDGAAWGLQSLTSWHYSKGTPQDDVTQVACAVNTFGQTDRYKNGAKNGYCITGKKQNSYFGTIVKVNGCAVTFTGSTTGSSNSKRDGSNETTEEDRTIGEIGGWGIEKIEISDSDEGEIFILDPDDEWAPHGQFMPVKYVD